MTDAAAWISLLSAAVNRPTGAVEAHRTAPVSFESDLAGVVEPCAALPVLRASDAAREALACAALPVAR